MLVEAGHAAVAGIIGVVAASMPSGTMADELGRPPATFHISDDVRPIEVANAEDRASLSDSPSNQSSACWSQIEDSPNAWKLRWRQPLVSTASAPTREKPLAVSRAVIWNKTEPKRNWGSWDSSGVRQASQVTPVDPFEEPYPSQPNKPNQPKGSSVPPSSRPIPVPLESTKPNTSESNPAQPNATEPDPFQPNAAPSTTRPEVQLPMTDEAPKPPSTTAPMSDLEQAPVPPRSAVPVDPLFAPVPDDLPCERTYNERNCCSDDAKCKQAHERFLQYKITSISLDITPSFTNTEAPNSNTYIPTDVRKQDKLAKAPSRIWKNRSGEVVAEGRFIDYRNGQILVRGADGQTKKVLFNALSDDDLCFVTAWWSLPTECTLVDEQFQGRNWLASTFTWKASALCHKPLYFEEVALERYGHSVGPIKQPFISGAHFFGSLAFLPYQMGIHPPTECQYALGYYRPGSCAPWLVPPVPFSFRGTLAEAAVIVGGIYALP